MRPCRAGHKRSPTTTCRVEMPGKPVRACKDRLHVLVNTWPSIRQRILTASDACARSHQASPAVSFRENGFARNSRPNPTATSPNECRKRQPDSSSPRVQQDVRSTRHFLTRWNQVQGWALDHPCPAVVARCTQILPATRCGRHVCIHDSVQIGAPLVRRLDFGLMAKGVARDFRYFSPQLAPMRPGIQINSDHQLPAARDPTERQRRFGC